MSTRKACDHEVLARSGYAQVSRCKECFCVSLDIGAVTLRLDEASLETLWFVLAEANVALQRRKAGCESRLPRA